MSDLRSLYESLGCYNVVTYIQSGNVFFESSNKSVSKLKKIIEDSIEKKYNFHVPVIMRSRSDLKSIIKDCPFGEVDLDADGTKVLVTFLAEKSKKAKIIDILKYVALPEKLIVKEKEVYLYCPNGYGKSKLSNTFLEKKLGVEATTRNWKSVQKLYELSASDL